jgi:hypothetical protein
MPRSVRPCVHLRQTLSNCLQVALGSPFHLMNTVTCGIVRSVFVSCLMNTVTCGIVRSVFVSCLLRSCLSFHQRIFVTNDHPFASLLCGNSGSLSALTPALHCSLYSLKLRKFYLFIGQSLEKESGPLACSTLFCREVFQIQSACSKA